MLKKLWVKKYMPETLKGFIFQNEDHKAIFEKFVEDKSIPHLLFKGHRGTGKTTLAFVLKNELGVADADFKVINASDDTSVEYVRSSIKSFIQTMPVGDFKIVFLDEADCLSSNAQSCLRRMMEEYSDNARFILTCNRPHKIIPELRDSRCQSFTFKSLDKGEMSVQTYRIMKSEGIKLDDPNILKEYVEDAYPDMRKLLMNIEANCINGVLRPLSESSDMDRVLVEMVDQLSKGKWLEVREHIITNLDNDEWDEIYRFFYDNLDQIDGFSPGSENWMKGILIIADHLKAHAVVADPEINFSAFMIKLSGVVSK